VTVLLRRTKQWRAETPLNHINPAGRISLVGHLSPASAGYFSLVGHLSPASAGYFSLVGHLSPVLAGHISPEVANLRP
jgi:hypothetical protein